MGTKTESKGTTSVVSDKGMAGRDEFIREITLRICGSLEIKESLRSAFEYLREHVPLECFDPLHHRRAAGGDPAH